jgi:uncharacterized protein (DUF2345 family)
MTHPDATEQRLPLHAGYALSLAARDANELRLEAPDGRLCLSIKLTPEGPKVELVAAALSIATEGDIALACRSFEVAARKDVVLDAGGEVRIRADETLRTEGVAQQHRATLGSIDLLANDDVSLQGERVRLNCASSLPTLPLSIPRLRQP